MNLSFVIPADAGSQLGKKNWVPAFAGMTMWLVFWLLFAAPATAQTFPPLTGRVVDQAGLLRPEQVVDLTSKSQALEAQTGRQFVVATVKSLEGRTIEDYGYRLGRTWAIGDKKKDDGVILLVAPNEKKVRIETGYGARVFLTDAISSVIIRDTIVPRFKAGDMGGGVIAGADQIVKTMQLSQADAARFDQQAKAAQQQRQGHRGDKGGGFPFTLIAFLFFFVLLPMMKRAGGHRYRARRGGDGGISPWVVLWGLNALGNASRSSGSGWGGGGGDWGGGGGGGFGGGGGSFGGGGASGGW
ncbi:MAG: TPM domain-containing protein [Sphingomicrobium sp.]